MNEMSQSPVEAHQKSLGPLKLQHFPQSTSGSAGLCIPPPGSQDARPTLARKNIMIQGISAGSTTELASNRQKQLINEVHNIAPPQRLDVTPTAITYRLNKPLSHSQHNPGPINPNNYQSSREGEAPRLSQQQAGFPPAGYLPSLVLNQNHVDGSQAAQQPSLARRFANSSDRQKRYNFSNLQQRPCD